ncbi:unnamed protein product, partial [Polarella glacialis]
MLPPRPPAGMPNPAAQLRDAPPAGARPPAGMRLAKDQVGGGRQDQLWSVMHQRAESAEPPGPGGRNMSPEPGRPRRPSSREGERESRSAPSRPGMEVRMQEYAPQYQPQSVSEQHRQQLPPIGWAAGPPVQQAVADPGWRQEMKLGPRFQVGFEGAGAVDPAWVERRLEAAQTEQRSDIARRYGTFEQSDRHFKEWVQREHEQLHAQLQQVKAAASEGQQQQQRQVGDLAGQCQKQDLCL